MATSKPHKLYEREANGFRGRKLFKPLLRSQREGVLQLQNTEGFTILIPPHFFESAYRRVSYLSSTKPLKANYIPSPQIEKLVSFIGQAENDNENRKYGRNTIQLILNIADAATHQRKRMLHKLKRLTHTQKRKIQENILNVSLENNRIDVSKIQDYESVIASQKLKFSSRTHRYPFVFSLVRDDADKVLINTVYLKGDSYPKNTLIVYRP